MQEEKNTLEEDILTTEMSDEELDLIYKRYKVMQHKNSDSMKDIEAEAYELVQQYNAGMARTEKDRAIRDYGQL